jgi:centromeric protein E
MDLASGEELVDAIRVAVRVRPLNARELSQVADSPMEWHVDKSEITQTMTGKPVSANAFSFDHVFDETADNATVFENLAKPVVHAALDGYNATIFAYGQTSSGKTHSMLGSLEDPGVTRRAVQEVFETVRRTTDREFLLRASYIEIYQEIIRDLLVPSHDNLKIHEDFNRRVYVESREEVVSSVDEVMAMIAAGESARAVGETQMNERSSRSHTIFTILIESRARRAESNSTEQDESASHDEGIAVRASTLSLVDLAGSERAALTGAEGVRLKEGSHINKSLLTLGNVINKLSSAEPGATAHVPYRDSKLTRILQPALGGNARTAILCAVTPAIMHMEETLSTLKFASRAKRVKNRTQCNEFLDDTAKLRRSERQVEHLKAQLASIQAQFMQGSASPEFSMTCSDHPVPSAAAEQSTRLRIKAFEQKFEEICRASESPQIARQRNNAVAALNRESCSSSSTSTLTPSAHVATTADPSLLGDSQTNAASSAGLAERVSILPSEIVRRDRDGLDLAVSRNVRRHSQVLYQKDCHPGLTYETHEAEIATLRRTVFEAERIKQRTLTAIEYERKAMSAEVNALAEAAEEAHRLRTVTEQQYELVMQKLARAEAASLVDEIISTSMTISESRFDLEEARTRLHRLDALELESQRFASKNSSLEQQLGELRAREKRGLGPILKEKNMLSEKLSDMERKLKSSKQVASKASSEKTTLEKDIIGRDRQIKVLENELEKRRKHENMSHNRVDKEVAAERKKFEEMRLEMSSEISKISHEKDGLESKLETLETNFRQKDLALSDIREKFASLEGRCRELESAESALLENLKTSTERFEDMKTKLDEAENKAAEARSEVDKIDIEMADIKLRLNDARAELVAVLSSQTEDKLEIGRLQELVEGANLKAESYLKANEENKAAATASQQEISRCHFDLENALREVQDAENKTRDAVTELQLVRESLLNQEEQMAAIKNQLSCALLQLQNQQELNAKDRAAAQKAIDLENLQTEEARRTLVALQGQLERVSTDFESHVLEATNILRAEREAKAELEATLEANQKRSFEMESRYANELAVILREAETERSAYRQEFESQKSRANEAKQACDKLKEQLEVANSKMESFYSTKSQMERDMERTAALFKTELDTARQGMVSMEQKCNHKLKAIRQEADSAVANAANLSLKVEEMRNGRCQECRNLAAKVSELQQVQKTISHELSAYKTSVKESRLAVELESGRLLEQVHTVQAAHAKDSDTLTEVLSKLYHRDDRIAELEAKLREYRLRGGAIQKLERKLERRQHALDELSAIILRQEELISGKGLSEEWLAEERVTRTESENNALRSSLAAREEQIISLEKNEIAGQKERQKLRQEIKARDLAREKAKAGKLQASLGSFKPQLETSREAQDAGENFVHLANKQIEK